MLPSPEYYTMPTAHNWHVLVISAWVVSGSWMNSSEDGLCSAVLVRPYRRRIIRTAARRMCKPWLGRRCRASILLRRQAAPAGIGVGDRHSEPIISVSGGYRMGLPSEQRPGCGRRLRQIPSPQKKRGRAAASIPSERPPLQNRRASARRALNRFETYASYYRNRFRFRADAASCGRKLPRPVLRASGRRWGSRFRPDAPAPVTPCRVRPCRGRGSTPLPVARPSPVS